MSTTLPKNEQGLRFGYTTGSCATAAAAAAAQMLLCGDEVSTVDFMTPKGIKLQLDIEHITREENRVRCGVKKDAGDDPDITDGIYIYAVAEISEEPGVQIEGGIGVGRVTRPGLDQPVGVAAINHVPREMITQEVSRVMEHARYDGGIRITIEIPEGVSLAAKTFNPRLGIEGGISVLGTSGIVEPMSEKALVDTIRVELRQRRESSDCVLLTPGNYGSDFIRDSLNIDPALAVQCSNFIGDALDICKELDFRGVLLIGHIGKLVKLAGGMMNTHSKYGDCRMEILAAHAGAAGLKAEKIDEILNCVACDDALRIIREEGCWDEALASLIRRIGFHLQYRGGGELQTGAVVFSKEYGILGQTPKAFELLNAIKEG